MSRGIRATGVLGSLVAVLTILVLWWGPWSDGAGPARDPDNSQDTNTPLVAEADDATIPEVQRDSVDDPPTGQLDPDDPERPLAKVEGTVLARRSRLPIRAGTVELAYLDPVAEGMSLEALLAMEEDERSWLESYDEAPIRGDGTFELSLPVGVVLRRAILKPTVVGEDLFGGFLDTDVDLEQAILGQEGTSLRLEVLEGFVITGEVKNAVTGLPVPDARVVVVWWSLEFSLDGDRTDERGRFRIGGLRPQVVAAASFLELQVRASGYVPLREKLPLEDPGESMTGVELRMTPGPSWVGTVVDPDGNPQDGALVTLTRVRGPDPLGADLEWVRTTRSDGDGRFDLGALEPGSDVDLFVRLPGRPVVLRRLTGSAPPPDLQVMLPRSSRLILQVSSDLELDRESLFVVARSGRDPRDAWRTQSSVVPRGLGVWVRRGEPADLWVRGQTYAVDGPATALRGSLRYLPDQPEHGVPVSLHAVEETEAGQIGLHLTVRQRATGRVLTDTPVSISETGGALWRTRYQSGEAGEFVLELPPGRHFLVVRSPGYQPRFVQVDLDWPGPWTGELLLQTDV